MTPPPVYLLGGYQTDFARNWHAAGLGMFDMVEETVQGALQSTKLDAAAIQTAHIGNLAGEIFCGQALLGGLLASVDQAFAGLPTARHEAACASSSVAALAATAEIEAGRYDVALVLGVEQMRNVPGKEAGQVLGIAAWAGREAVDSEYPWPDLFSELLDEYERRWPIEYEYLIRIAEINLGNARVNSNAQTRGWTFGENAFTADDVGNPVVSGRLRQQDCGRITDGGAAIVLASRQFAAAHADRNGIALETIPYVSGWGHRTAPMLLADKVSNRESGDYLLPHLRRTITDAYRRAGIEGSQSIDVFETHDCFTITEYVALEHFGLAEPGKGWQAVESGAIERDGISPVNPSGGLLGLGHPVGATGARMLLDAYRQVTGTAGEYQIPDARRAATLNVGGSITAAVGFIVEREDRGV